MEEKLTQLKTALLNCFLKKLKKSYDETEHPIEYKLHAKTLEKSIPILRSLLRNYDLTQDGEDTFQVLSLLLALYYELHTVGPWNTHLSANYALNLSWDFKMKYNITLDKLLFSKSFNCSKIFYMMMERLHRLSAIDNLKKYPSCIEVYCFLITHLKKFDFDIELAKVLPTALILIEDYVKSNKLKGLNACKIIISSLPADHFKGSNYHEVIYKTLSSALKEKDLMITQLVLDSLSEYIRVLPSIYKEKKLDEMFSLIVEETYMETNFKRKSVCFSFITKLIKIHGVNCVREKKKFTQVLSENIEHCAYHSIQKVMCNNLLECLEEWVNNCWCVVTFATDKTLISSLIKLLYALKKSQTQTTEKVLTITSAIIQLCSNEDQTRIIKNIQSFNSNKDSLFSLKLDKLLEKNCNI